MSVKKWYPTGNMAWKQSMTHDPILVREFVELDVGELDATHTGNYEWRPVPILPDNPPAPVPSDLVGIPYEDYPGIPENLPGSS
jgi:hypothetical protein